MGSSTANISVIPTVEPSVSVHILPAVIAGNGMCLQIHSAGQITGRAYIPWRYVPLLEEAIRRAREMEGEQQEELPVLGRLPEGLRN